MIFRAPGLIAVAATKTALIVGSTANIRPRILSYNMSTSGVPASDQGIEVSIQRATALGTSTAVTLAASDPSDTGGTPVVTAGSNCSVEPTYAGTALDDYCFNPRATIRWQAYSPDDELILPATASNGIGFQIQIVGGAVGNLKVNAVIRQ